MTAWLVSVSTMIYEKDPDRCSPGVCINTEGGFACDCDAGYQPSDDGMACIVMTAWLVSVSTMIYEKDPDRCSPGVCINTEGGFACDCDAGYQPSDDGMACIGEYDDL
ncbi:hypothetical protein PYW07_002994 [Mythimna separata]|uniref:Uncharacterized protein n=1 Tax=Mythimna separata TaxID=271217 RepID=A0AAD7YHW9_MYTSE|nr:hypothetical protein PYW07_002994 [Mythimna separata]